MKVPAIKDEDKNMEVLVIEVVKEINKGHDRRHF